LIRIAETDPDTNNAVISKMNVDAPPSAIYSPHASVDAMLTPLTEIATLETGN